ncbi:MAG: mechanosensitive ion channel family protein [Candidatus Binataceae bacterium]|jgi:small conductance mechanosensitive channel
MEQAILPHQLDFYTAMVWTWSVAFLPRLITTVVILIIGFFVSGWVGRRVRAILARSPRVDETIEPVIAAIARYGILILVFVAALAQIGIQTASLFAVLGAAGLAIGLALQGTLTNIAAGILLLWLRPFRLGDYIEVPSNNISGIVREIGLFVCLLESFDGILIFAPNSAIWNSALRNHSRSSGRLICFTVTLPSASEAEKASRILTTLIAADRRVLKEPPPIAFVDNRSGGGATVLNCSFRVPPDKVGEVQRTIIGEAERQLEAAGTPALVPQQIVRTVPADNDPSRLLATPFETPSRRLNNASPPD